MNSQRQFQTFGLNGPGHTQPGLLSKLFALMLSAGLLVVGFMFSLVALVVVVCGGLIVGGWLWWKTRQLRQEISRQRSAQRFAQSDDDIGRDASNNNATIIDGTATLIPDDSASAPGAR